MGHDPDTCEGCFAMRAIPATPSVGIPAARVRAFLRKVQTGTSGHLVDPTGNGGRWVAGRGGMWSESAGRTRTDYLR